MRKEVYGFLEKTNLQSNILTGLSSSYITNPSKHLAGFKLNIETRDIISLSNTVESLLILEQLYGKNFMFYTECKHFDFAGIKSFLIAKKNELLHAKPDNQKNIKVSDIAYCGIGFLLLHCEDETNEIRSFLEQYKITFDTNKFAWSTYLLDKNADVFATYLVIKFYNRLHCQLPDSSWFDGLIKSNSDNGIIISIQQPDMKYIESLVIVAYTLKFYYHKPISDKVLKSINKYCSDRIKIICDGKADAFPQHPILYYHLFSFGLAADVLRDYNMSIFNKKNIWDGLNTEFHKSTKNIPYMLELIRVYNSEVASYDPCNKDVQKSLENLESKIDVLSKTDYFDSFIHKIALTVIVYAVLCFLIGFVLYSLGNLIISFVANSVKTGTSLLETINELVTFVGEVLILGTKKTRKIFVKIASFIVNYITQTERSE